MGEIQRVRIQKAENGHFYITPAAKAKPEIYDPLKDSEQMVLDALSIGALQMKRKGEAAIRDAIMDFVGCYGLLGFLTALPTTPSFMDYAAVYLPKNHFIREESMSTQDYLALFFPFEKLDIHKKGVRSQWNLTGDRTMMALALTMQDAPRAVSMSFQREYAERYKRSRPDDQPNRPDSRGTRVIPMRATPPPAISCFIPWDLLNCHSQSRKKIFFRF